MRDNHRNFDREFAKRWPSVRQGFLTSIRDMVAATQIGRVETAVSEFDIDAAMAALNVRREFLAPLDAAIAEVFEGGAGYMRSTIPGYARSPTGGRLVVRFDLRNPRAEQWVRENAVRLVDEIVDDQRVAVRRMVESGIAQGHNPRKTALDIAGRMTGQRRQGGVVGLHSDHVASVVRARQQLESGDPAYFRRQLRDRRFDATIRKAFDNGKTPSAAQIDKIIGRYADRYLRYRGEVIARTEATAALNGGRIEQVRQIVERGEVSAEAVERQWEDTGDGRTRPSHNAADGQRVGLNEPFTVGGFPMMHPADSSLGAPARETAQCRCYMQTRIDWIGSL